MGMEMDMGPASMDATGRPPHSWAGAPSPGRSSPRQSGAITPEVSSRLNRA